MSLLDSIYINLRIISKIQDNGRLSTTNHGQVKLENDGYGTTLWRTLTGDSREQTAKFLRQLINDVTELSDNIINSLVIGQNTDNDKIHSMFQLNENSKKCHQLRKLSRELGNSKRGITNLHNTYNKDANITSKIEEVIDNIDVQIEKIQKALAIIEGQEKQRIARITSIQKSLYNKTNNDDSDDDNIPNLNF